ncbi:MAG: T9SS type A sorting domain-containing protein, partial [Calditrichota bacterium]
GSTGVSAGPGKAVNTGTEAGATLIGSAIWGDDPSTPEIDGAIEGEALTFKLWNGKSEKVIKPDWKEGSNVYSTDGFAYGEVDLRQTGMSVLPEGFYLAKPSPNPFNQTTRIAYSLDESGEVRLAVFDVQGRLAQELFQGRQSAGQYVVTLGEDNLVAGIYFVRLELSGRTASQKVVLLK